MREDTEKLMAAAENGEHGTIARAGWNGVYHALRDWWSARFDLPKFAPYLDVLDGEEPRAVLGALRELRASEWRPAPSAVYRQLHPPEPAEPVRDRHGQRKRKDQSPQALAEVRRRLAEGEAQVCSCDTRPFRVLVDQSHVLHCDRCGGIEQGQAYEAEDEVRTVLETETTHDPATGLHYVGEDSFPTVRRPPLPGLKRL